SATSTVTEAVAVGRKASADVRKGAADKRPALVAARDLLGRFSKHLDAQPAGSVDRKTYFVADGTIKGIGQSAARTQLALNHIASALAVSDTKVKDAAEWGAQFSEAAQTLAPLLAN